MTIPPTIRPEIKKENERQRKQMMEKHKEYKKLINNTPAGKSFREMMDSKLRDQDA